MVYRIKKKIILLVVSFLLALWLILSISPSYPWVLMTEEAARSAPDLVVQSGHLTFVSSVSFSPDGKILASGSGDCTVKLWRASDGKLIRTLEGHKSGVLSIAFSPDGKLLSSASGRVSGGGFGERDNTIKFWRVSDGRLIRTLEGHTGDVTSVAFSPDGKVLASGSRDHTIKLWRVSDGKLIRTFEGHNDVIESVSFSPDGTLLASGGWDEAINLWRVSDGRLIRTINGHKIRVNSVSFSPDGRLLASGGGDKTIKLWRVSDGKLIRTFEGHKDTLFSVAFSPDGKVLASGSLDHTIKLWQVSDGRLIRTLEGHKYDVDSIAFSLDGEILASSGATDGSIKLWDYKNSQLILTLFTYSDASVALTPEGFFSGTGDFNKYVHFVKGLEIYDFNQFYDAFYRPDLVEKKLKGEDISKYTGGLNIEDALKNPPPKVTILSPKEGDTLFERTVTVRVKIEDTGGQIGDIRIYHNGKLVDSLGVYRLAKTGGDEKQTRLAKADIKTPYKMARGATLRRVMEDKDKRDIQIVEFTPLKGTVEKTYKITLIGGENIISVSAFNGANTVMSAMESIKIKAEIPEREPEIFAIIVGNNHFKEPTWNLSLAIKDAEDFSNLLKEVATPLYKKVNIKTLTDADKSSIIEVITAIKAKMKPEDIFIFFAATHGWAEDDMYYLYTRDFDGNLWSKNSSITSIEFMEFSKWIPALKQVFIFDTCQAGGVEAVVSGLYDARISVLAKALGMHIFAGAKAYQEALDEYKGNGLFTHFVLNGLKGEADKDNNKQVTVFEMNPYLTHTVKERSQGRQEPFIRNFVDDLPLSKIVSQ